VKRTFLGIDCGTQSTKAIVLDAESGGPIAVGRGSHRLIDGADGTREQEPSWWTDALVVAVRQALAATSDIQVVGMGVSGQQHGLVCLDERDRPVRPAKLWNDTTTTEACASLTERLGGVQALLGLTGNVFLPGYTAPKVEWLRVREPDRYARARRFCLPHDYVNLWLTGVFATEPGDASGTAYFDVRDRRYSEPVLEALDPERDWADTLPDVVPSRSVLGTLREASARELGLPPGVPVSAGGGDNMCAAIGVGAIREGPVVVSLGTSGTAFAYRDRPAFDPDAEAAAFCDSTGGWLPLACTLNCTGVTEWALTLAGRGHRALDQALRSSPPGARGLAFLPYLDGERTPSCAAGSATLTGLRSEHGISDILRAAVEGVTFGLGYAFAALRRTGVRPTEVTLVGGGAASDGWAQLCADALELPVTRSGAIEAAGIGAALQARWAIDGRAPDEPRKGRRFEPRPTDALREAASRVAGLRRLALDGRL